MIHMYTKDSSKLAIDILTTHQPHQQAMMMHVFIEGKTYYNTRYTYTLCRASCSEFVTLKVLFCAHDYFNRSMHGKLIVWGGLDGDLVHLLQCVRCEYSAPPLMKKEKTNLEKSFNGGIRTQDVYFPHDRSSCIKCVYTSYAMRRSEVYYVNFCKPVRIHTYIQTIAECDPELFASH